MEGSNKFKNQQINDICMGHEVRGEDWLQLNQRLDKRTLTRLHRIDETGKCKPTKKTKTRRDNAYATIIREYKAKRISHDEYVRKIVKLRRIHEAPKTRAALLRRITDSDDSDSE